jgi:hypothetical protein
MGTATLSAILTRLQVHDNDCHLVMYLYKASTCTLLYKTSGGRFGLLMLNACMRS